MVDYRRTYPLTQLSCFVLKPITVNGYTTVSFLHAEAYFFHMSSDGLSTSFTFPYSFALTDLGTFLWFFTFCHFGIASPTQTVDILNHLPLNRISRLFCTDTVMNSVGFLNTYFGCGFLTPLPYY